MLGQNQRRSLRVPFQVPARVLGSLKHVEGHLEDLSRSGARLRIPLASLHLDRGCSLADLGARVQAAIEADCEVQLHHLALGCLMTKRSHVVRLALPHDGSDTFDLGCLFEVPLSNEETVMLGVALPAGPDASVEWLPRADVAGPMTRTAPSRAENAPTAASAATRGTSPADTPAAQPATGIARRLSGRQILRWRGFVLPKATDSASALPCALDEVSRLSVRLRVLRNPGTEGAAIMGDDPASAGIAFTSRYGDHVNLKLTDGPTHLWTGPAQVRAVEVPQGTMRDLILTLDFDRSLTPPELGRLGLA